MSGFFHNIFLRFIYVVACITTSSLFLFLKVCLILFLAVLLFFVVSHRLSLVAVSWGYSWLQCSGFSLPWLLLLQSKGSRHGNSVIEAHRLSCSLGVLIRVSLLIIKNTFFRNERICTGYPKIWDSAYNDAKEGDLRLNNYLEEWSIERGKG